MKLALILTLAFVPQHLAPGTVVYPTGSYPADVNAVQAAVNLGGTVLLKATNDSGTLTAFNFGPPVAGSGSVVLTVDVDIVGETVGTNMTTITGGSRPFRSSGIFEPAVIPVRSSISGIFFNGPRVAALEIDATNGVTFSNNRVSNIVGVFAFGQSFSTGVRVLGLTGPQSGGIIVADNDIENSLGTASDGVALLLIGTNVQVARNTIRGVNTAGIIVDANSNPAVVEDNFVVPGAGNGAEGGGANGIFAADSLGGPYFIHRNTVICESPLADGILFSGSATVGFPFSGSTSGSVAEENDVTMHNSLFGGISFYGSADHSSASQNKIAGDGAFALQIAFGSFPGDIAEEITLQGNDISQFQSSVANVFFDVNTINDVLVGNSGTVLDLGQQNRITGNGPMGHGQIGQQIKDAQAVKRALMKTIRDLEASAARTF